MLTTLAEDVQPSNPAAQLSESQLLRAFNFSLMKFDSSLTVDELDDQQALTVLAGAMAKCYWLIAAKFAEGMRVEVENDEFYGQMPYEHYVSLAQSHEAIFEGACGGATIEVSTLRRRSLRTGQMVPLPPGDNQ
jgi:hypothetical protein